MRNSWKTRDFCPSEKIKGTTHEISSESSFRELFTRVPISIVKFPVKVLFAAETDKEIDRSYPLLSATIFSRLLLRESYKGS